MQCSYDVDKSRGEFVLGKGWNCFICTSNPFSRTHIQAIYKRYVVLLLTKVERQNSLSFHQDAKARVISVRANCCVFFFFLSSVRQCSDSRMIEWPLIDERTDPLPLSYPLLSLICNVLVNRTIAIEADSSRQDAVAWYFRRWRARATVQCIKNFLRISLARVFSFSANFEQTP